MKRLAMITAVLALALSSIAGASPSTYTPGSDYGEGPQGGDGFNYIHRDTDTGELTVMRAYFIPGAINCAGAGPFSYFRVVVPDAPASTFADVAYASATIDNFTWMNVHVSGSESGWLGFTTIRGPLVAAEGTLQARFKEGGSTADATSIAGETITIDFGLQVASACPNFNGGTAVFPSVTLG